MLLQWLRFKEWLGNCYWWFFTKEAGCYRVMNSINIFGNYIPSMLHLSRLDYFLNKRSWHKDDTRVENILGRSIIKFKHPITIKADSVPYLLESGLGVEENDNSMMMEQ